MSMKQATIAVSPYITVCGTLMTMSMMIDPPPAGKTAVMSNGKVHYGTLLGKPIPMEPTVDVETMLAAADADLATEDLVDIALG